MRKPRKSARARPLDDSAQLRLIADNLPAMTIAYDEKLRCLFANRRFAEFFGLTTVSIVGKHLREVIGEAPYQEVKPYFDRVLEGHRTTYQRTRVLDGGEPRYLEVELIPHTGQDGRSRGLFAVTSDVTERTQAEMALQESRKALTTIIDNLPFLAWLKDSEGRFLAVNEPFARSCGLPSANDLIGKTDLDVWPKHLADAYRADDCEVMRSREKKAVEEPIFDRGEEKWFETYKAPLYNASGSVSGTTGFARDITERKQFEQKLRASLAEKEVLMREIHHRVKNNLQTMSALLELQARYVKDEQVLGFFRDSQQRIQAMAMVHAQLYQYGEFARIDFAAYLRTLVDHLRVQYGERCNRVNLWVDAQPCTLPVDAAIPCALVLTELVSNAMKHAFPGGRACRAKSYWKWPTTGWASPRRRRRETARASACK